MRLKQMIGIVHMLTGQTADLSTAVALREFTWFSYQAG